MSICWICEQREATTGEHIFKHSFLREMYGSGKLQKGNRLILWEEKIRNSKEVLSKTYIDSTNADIFKFKKSLCEYCNGAKSKTWDDEFDRFLKHYLTYHNTLLPIGYISLKKTKPSYTKTDAKNLYKYFCKLFGCLLFTHKLEIPRGLVDAVNGFNYPNHLGINLIYSMDLKDIPEPKDYLVNHELIGTQGHDISYRWALGFGPLKIEFWYKTPKEFIIGDCWFGKSQNIPFTRN